MKLTKFLSDQVVNVNLTQYRINWDRKVSAPQKKCKDILFPHWKFDNVYEEVRIPGSKKRIDLWNETKKIIIEVSPDKVHSEYNDFFHKGRSGFLKKLQTDQLKRSWCLRNNYDFLELNDDDIKNFSYELMLLKLKEL